MENNGTVFCRCGRKMFLVQEEREATLFDWFTNRAFYQCHCGWRSPVSKAFSDASAKRGAYIKATRHPISPRPFVIEHEEDIQCLPDKACLWILRTTDERSQEGLALMPAGSVRGLEITTMRDYVIAWTALPEQFDIEMECAKRGWTV